MATVLVVDDSPVDQKMVCGLLGSDPTINLLSANNGNDALRIIEESVVDAIVTDMVMPEMNGMELVSRICSRHDHVPTILMTSHGSEELAVEALKAGASNYVLKSDLSKRLLVTVQEVLSLAESDRDYQQLISDFESVAYQISLENEVKLIEPLVGYVQQMLLGMRVCDPVGSFQVATALYEAISNAILRGNLELSKEQTDRHHINLEEGIHTSLSEQRNTEQPYRDRRVRITINIDADEARFVIKDEGRGFDVDRVIAEESAAAIGADENRGIVLMRSFMDELKFNEAGNEVTMIKIASLFGDS